MKDQIKDCMSKTTCCKHGTVGQICCKHALMGLSPEEHTRMLENKAYINMKKETNSKIEGARALKNAYAPLFAEQDIQDAARFSNFAQRVKMKWWEERKNSRRLLVSEELDEILLIAWKEMKEKYDIKRTYLPIPKDGYIQEKDIRSECCMNVGCSPMHESSYMGTGYCGNHSTSGISYEVNLCAEQGHHLCSRSSEEHHKNNKHKK